MNVEWANTDTMIRAYIACGSGSDRPRIMVHRSIFDPAGEPLRASVQLRWPALQDVSLQDAEECAAGITYAVQVAHDIAGLVYEYTVMYWPPSGGPLQSKCILANNMEQMERTLHDDQGWQGVRVVAVECRVDVAPALIGVRPC